MSNWFAVFWLVLAVVFVVVELSTVQLVSVWLALGAAITAILSLTGMPLLGQLAVFVLSSGIALLLSRPLARKILKRKHVPTNADAVVGMEGIVTQPVNNLREEGRVYVNGLSWSARSVDGTELPDGTRVRVERIEGAKIIVVPTAVCSAVNL